MHVRSFWSEPPVTAHLEVLWQPRAEHRTTSIFSDSLSGTLLGSPISVESNSKLVEQMEGRRSSPRRIATQVHCINQLL